MYIFRLFFGLILLISFSLPVHSSSTKIYVWRDEAGILVYSDSPRPGAEEVIIKDNDNIIKSVGTSVLDINPKVIEDKYQVIITQPENNSTVRDNNGSVHVSGLIKPIFKRDLFIQLYIDDIPYGEAQTQAVFALRNVDRGEHTIKMQLIDDKGKVIASSSPLTFFMHRTSAVRAK